jgi:hypothetical protein
LGAESAFGEQLLAPRLPLVPEIPRSAVPERLRPRERFPIRLLGVRTAIWVYDRT